MVGKGKQNEHFLYIVRSRGVHRKTLLSLSSISITTYNIKFWIELCNKPANFKFKLLERKPNKKKGFFRFRSGHLRVVGFSLLNPLEYVPTIGLPIK